MTTKQRVDAVLAFANEQCSGDRAQVYELLLRVVVAFACESKGCNKVLRLAIDALTAAVEAGEQVDASWKPS